MTDRKETNSYKKNFKVKFRRRREGKTDYRHRTNMIRQDVNKYGAIKSRLVVRITNSKVICQVIKAYVNGDRVVAEANSTELKKYGITFGLTNYFAAYATGMLCGRRALAVNGLSNYAVNKECGEFRETEDDMEGRRAYKVFLDIGLAASTKGAKVFAAMKGASDAGLYIPHSPKLFAGYDGENLNAEELKERILMKENIQYMEHMKTNDPERFKKQFSSYVAAKVELSSIVGLYLNVLAQIAEVSSVESKKKKEYSGKKFNTKRPKLSLEERKKRIAAKLSA